jgi:hypothetical protein
VVHAADLVFYFSDYRFLTSPRQPLPAISKLPVFDASGNWQKSLDFPGK